MAALPRDRHTGTSACRMLSMVLAAIPSTLVAANRLCMKRAYER